MPERVVVLGGTGFIGRALVSGLAAKGFQPVVASRGPDKARALFGDTAEAAPWDGRSAPALAQLVDGARAVVNLVGEPIAAGRWTAARKALILDSRVKAAQAVVSAMKLARARPEALLQGSAVGWYGPRGDEKLDEGSGPGKGFLADTAGKWEEAAKGATALGVRLALLRTGIVLDKGGGALEKFLPPFRLFLGGPLGSGAQWMPWIHRRDMAGAILHLLDNAHLSGPFNLAAPGSVTMKDFCAALGRAMGRPSLLPVPGFALKLLMGAEMAEELVLSGQRAEPGKLLQSGYRFRHPDLDSALAACLAGR